MPHAPVALSSHFHRCLCLVALCGRRSCRAALCGMHARGVTCMREAWCGGHHERGAQHARGEAGWARRAACMQSSRSGVLSSEMQTLVLQQSAYFERCAELAKHLESADESALEAGLEVAEGSWGDVHAAFGAAKRGFALFLLLNSSNACPAHSIWFQLGGVRLSHVVRRHPHASRTCMCTCMHTASGSSRQRAPLPCGAPPPTRTALPCLLRLPPASPHTQSYASLQVHSTQRTPCSTLRMHVVGAPQSEPCMCSTHRRASHACCLRTSERAMHVFGTFQSKPCMWSGHLIAQLCAWRSCHAVPHPAL
jgi:hypothetical protein